MIGMAVCIFSHPRSLVFDIQYVPREDSFRTTNKVAQTLHKTQSLDFTSSPGVPTSKLRDPSSFWTKWPHSWLPCPVSLRRTGNVSFIVCAATFYTNTALSVADCHDNQDIPHLEARVDIDNSYKESSLNLHPSQDLMNQAYKVKIDMGWSE